MSSERSRRRWVLPVVVVLVGGALAWWGAARETKRMHAIEQQVKAICDDLANGRDMTGRLDPDNPAVENLTLAEVRKALKAPGAAELVHIRAVSGDLDQPGGPAPSAFRATHVATLMIGDVELLHLRIRCDDPNEPITILGFAKPR